MNTKNIKTKIASIALMGLFSASAFAAGVATTTAELEKATLTGLKGTTITYTDAEGAKKVITFDADLSSAYTLDEIDLSELDISSIEDYDGHYITKYLDNQDGTYTPVYYKVVIDGKNYGGDTDLPYYWQANGTISTTKTDNLAFTITYDGTAIKPILADGNYTGNGIGNTSSAINITSGEIGTITGDFIGNSASVGGAIYNNSGEIGTITGDFIGNSASGGGAIYNNSGEIGTITGDFIGNSATNGGAIYNSGGTINLIAGDFIGNSSSSYGGAIYNINSEIGTIIGDFIGNSSSSHGGAIYNNGGTINLIAGDFIGNSSLYNGGAIYNSGTVTVEGSFIGNSATDSSYTYGGAIYNSGGTVTVTGDFIGNSTASSYGGAIYNNSGTVTVEGSFIGNYAKISGAAIYNKGTFNLYALSDSIEITGNYTTSSGAFSAIYNSGTINIDALDNKTITINDSISGSSGEINLNSTDLITYSASSYSEIYINNNVANQTVTLSAGTLTLGDYSSETLSVNGSTITTSNSSASFIDSTLQINSGLELILATDVTFTSSELILSGAKLIFEGDSTLTIDSDSGLTISDTTDFTLDVSDIDGYEFNYELISIINGNEEIYEYMKDNLTVVYGDSTITDWTLSNNGTVISISGTVVVPEPSTYALIFGVLSLGFVAYRRRK